MPPPSLSATSEQQLLRSVEKKELSTNPKLSADFRPVLFPIPKGIPVVEEEDEDDDEEDDDDEEEEDYEEDEEDDDDDEKSLRSKTSIPSFSQSQTPSTSTTRSYAMSSSPPHTQEPTRSRWMETIAQLRRSLIRSTSPRKEEEEEEEDKVVVKKKNIDFIPMPLPPKRNVRKRRSEATTQPRFNPETNTYTRDTRSNPDHLRMISAELNMMRSRKLSSPLKPRGFLPRRTDSFIRGDKRRLSILQKEVLPNNC
ncbi:uncharacterized protein EV154DRAFT_513733 [Mucor mucedo]|uniref:uncharacterized protein n=1 Tax=Mucor mucedo TaxID=29922 RepID=UPI00221FDFEC|nr:uncharacterized protein EV154DRAFT_513733 [Mucor mucedo]KAI7889681.1 hypothetical protein EV154DRAFT_513733 [Mucor mucedo]